MTKTLFLVHSGRYSGPPASLLRLIEVSRATLDASVVVPEPGVVQTRLAEANIPYVVNGLRYRHLPSLMGTILWHNFPLVYANSLNARTLTGLLAGQLLRRRTICHVREIIPPLDDGNTTSYHRQLYDRLQRCDAIIAVSKDAAHGVRRLIGDHKHLSVIYNGIDFDQFDLDRHASRSWLLAKHDLAPDRCVIVQVGYLDERKNQLNAVAAVAALAELAPQAVLLILGDDSKMPDYTRRVRAAIAEHNLQDRVHIVGFTWDVPRYLRGADVLLHTSKREAHPRAIIEGMGARLPVVAYRATGMAETVQHGQTGFLAELDATNELAEHLRRLINDSPLRQALGEAGYAYAKQHFSDKTTAKNIIRVIEEVVGSSHS